MAINKVFLSGRLVRDPQLKTIRPGMVVAEMTLAVNHVTRTKEGEINKEVCFIDFSAWGKRAQWCTQNLSKGSPLTISGRLKMDSWTDKTSGAERTKLGLALEELVIPDPLEEEPQRPQQQPVSPQEIQRKKQVYSQNYEDEDLPF